MSNGESTGTTEIGGSYWNSLERQVGPDCERVSRLGDLMFLCEGARALGKFHGESNTTEMITLAGRFPGHGESLEAER